MTMFSVGNNKLLRLHKAEFGKLHLAPTASRGRRQVYSFDLLSGHTCPGANECLSKAMERDDGSRYIQDGPDIKFRCFSASQEARLEDVYAKRKRNFDAVRGLTMPEMVDAIAGDLPTDAGIVRIHVAGDFFSEAYMMAWIQVAKLHPSTHFYAYTKSLRIWARLRDRFPPNLAITASRGGRYDRIIDRFNMKQAIVVFSPEQAAKLGLEIDHDDSHAADPSKGSFALLIHGTQPAGSESGKAMRELRKRNIEFSYGK